MGLVIGSAGNKLIGDMVVELKDENGIEMDANVKGIGFAAQYEYQPFERMSLAARLAYLNFETTMTSKVTDGLPEDIGLTAVLIGDVTLSAAEGHIRTYPFAGSFFLDLVLGYTRLKLAFSGAEFVESSSEEYNYGRMELVKRDFYVSQGFFKPGLKLGWRINFGKNGGIIFEPAFNFCYAKRLGGPSIVQQILKKTNSKYDKETDDAMKIIESFALIGGPGMSLSFGYRF